MKFDYKKLYGIYKKSPLITYIAVVVCSLAWGIIDACCEITAIGYELYVGAAFIWPLIGAVVAFIPAFCTAITMSPIVLQTEALLQLNNGSTPSTSIEDELPEL